jgi:hypothetical protein
MYHNSKYEKYKEHFISEAIISLLVMGTNVLPTQANAQASQGSGQDNLCATGEECQQANEGQQATGKDNDATGFNDQSNNGQPSAGTGSGNGDGTTPGVTPDTTPDTTGCEDCFRDNLNPARELTFFTALNGPGISVGGVLFTDITTLCLALEAGTVTPAQLSTAFQVLFGNPGPGLAADISACIDTLRL